MSHSRKTIQAGFTLVELMIVLVVAVILLTVAVPNFNDLMRNNRMVTAVNAMAGAMNAARSEAIAQRRPVTICPSTNGTACGGTWSDGWIAFLDEDRDGVVDTGETVVRRGNAAHPTISIELAGLTDPDSFIFFRPSGFPYEVGAAAGSDFSGGTYVFCDERGDTHARALNIGTTGRVSLATDTDGDGIVNGADGDNVSCS